MKSIFSKQVVMGGIALASLVGCSAGSGEPIPAGDEALPSLSGYSEEQVGVMLEGARAMGFDTTGVEAYDGQLVLDGDIGFDPSTLLFVGTQLKEPAPAFDNHLAPDGYSSQITTIGQRPGGQWVMKAPNATSLKLVFAADVPTVWKTAYRAAIKEWNGNSCIKISETAGDKTLLIQMDAGLSSSTIARGTFPGVVETSTGGRGKTIVWFPGLFVRVNPNITNLSANGRLSNAIHELGHNLGFTHPNEGTFILGTESSSYQTIMVDSLPASPLTALSADDKKSRDIQYKKIDGKCPDGILGYNL